MSLINSQVVRVLGSVFQLLVWGLSFWLFIFWADLSIEQLSLYPDPAYEEWARPFLFAVLLGLPWILITTNIVLKLWRGR